MRAVRFDEYGDAGVLRIAEVRAPTPGPGEVLVRVRAAGINPGEIAIRSGAMDDIAPASFPEGQGTDLAGLVEAVGEGVVGSQVGAGHAVIGWSDRRGAHADLAVLPAANTLSKPERMAWEQAAVLPTVLATAASAMEALDPQPGETVVVAGASGGVGHILVQLLRRAGVRVIGTASEPKHAALRELGVEPVAYGDGVGERLRAATPDGVDAFADCHGDGNVDLALLLGVPARRINTIIDFASAKSIGAQARGMHQLEDIQTTLAPLVDLVADGELQVPVIARLPLEQVRDAYLRMGEANEIGKVVLDVSNDDGSQ